MAFVGSPGQNSIDGTDDVVDQTPSLISTRSHLQRLSLLFCASILSQSRQYFRHQRAGYLLPWFVESRDPGDDSGKTSSFRCSCECRADSPGTPSLQRRRPEEHQENARAARRRRANEAATNSPSDLVRHRLVSARPVCYCAIPRPSTVFAQ